MYTSKQQSGFSLVEVLVAISILLLALVGPMTIAAKGIQSSIYIQQQTTALFLAQEGIEAFVAARNEAALVAFDGAGLDTSWDWVSTIPASCFDKDEKCGLDYRDNDPLSTIVSCATKSDCDLYFDKDKNQARYSLESGGDLTPYTRIIKLKTIASGKGLQIKSTVSWKSGLFGGQIQRMTLITSLFSIYE